MVADMRVNVYRNGKEVEVRFNIREKEYGFKLKKGQASKKEIRQAIAQYMKERKSNAQGN
jgi:hypothetical protein